MEAWKLLLNAANGKAWNIEHASFSNSFDISAQATMPSSIIFGDNGTKFYIVDRSSSYLYQYYCSTAYNLNTASYASISLNVSSNSLFPSGLVFKPDGSKCFIINHSSNQIAEYALSTAWDISTATYTGSGNIATQITNGRGLVFNQDGNKVFVSDDSSDTADIDDAIYQFSLATAWDITSISYDSVYIVVASLTQNVRNIAMDNSGRRLFLLGLDQIRELQLGTAFELSHVTATARVYSGLTQAEGLCFRPDGKSFYISSSLGVQQYLIT